MSGKNKFSNSNEIDFPGYNNSTVASNLQSHLHSNLNTSSKKERNLNKTNDARLNIIADIKQPKLNLIMDPQKLPTSTFVSSTLPVKTYDTLPPIRYNIKRVDSKSESKMNENNNNNSFYGNVFMNENQVLSPHNSIQSPKFPFSPTTHNFMNSPIHNNNDSIASPPPLYVGTSYTHLPSSPIKQPQNQSFFSSNNNNSNNNSNKSNFVTIPRPYPVVSNSSIPSNMPLLINRTANGRILGNPSVTTKRIVDANNVPYLPPDEPVGPDNPMKQLTEIWTACWDNEAGAIYYYNQQTGEATWVPPDM
eukprot:gene11789-15776_t